MSNKQFAQLTEAYQTLSNPSNRKAYDQQLSQQDGYIFNTLDPQKDISSFFHFLEKVTHKVHSLSTDDINQTELYNCLHYFYGEASISNIQKNTDEHKFEYYLSILLHLLKPLKYEWVHSYYQKNHARLSQHQALLQQIESMLSAKKKQQQLRTWTPVLYLLVAVFICIIIFGINKKL